jgi:hypothetical protein
MGGFAILLKRLKQLSVSAKKNITMIKLPTGTK